MTLSPRAMLRSYRFAALLVLTGCGAAFSVKAANPVDFSTLELADTSNQYLVCPVGLCQRAEPHLVSPIFDVSADDLRMAWNSVVAAAPRTRREGVFDGGQQVVDIQRSAVFRFPDIITTRFIDLDHDRATLAIYSRSVYGRSDFGVNKKRIIRWIADLALELQNGAPS
jgi:uncharacterized protein (DUF1499 family)